MPNALAPALTDRSIVLELDNLDIYRVSLEFQGFLVTILSSAHGQPSQGRRRRRPYGFGILDHTQHRRGEWPSLPR